MAPRKRKAPEKIMSPIREKEDMDEGAAEDGGQVAERDRAIEQIDQAVDASCAAILKAAQDLVSSIRQELELNLLKLPKKVREMSVADFFGLSAAEASCSYVADLHARVAQISLNQEMNQADVAPATARPTRSRAATGAASAEPAAGLLATAMATRTTRRAAAAGGRVRFTAAEDDLQSESSMEALPATVVRPAGGVRAGRPPLPLPPRAAAAPADGTSSAHGTPTNAAAAGRPLQPIARSPSAAPSAAEGVAAPPTGGGFASPTGGRAGPSAAGRPAAEARPQLPLQPQPLSVPPPPQLPVGMTPAAAGFAGGAPPGGGAAAASVLGMMTIVKKTAAKARGRTKKAGGDDTAIMVTTQDGKQYCVDGSTGLAMVPAAARDEVKAQLEMLQRLSAAALKM